MKEPCDYLNMIPPQILNDLQKQISQLLDKSGMFYRIFGRYKSAASIEEKCSKKTYDSSKKIQDIVGIRIILYFFDDVTICEQLLSREFEVIDISKDISNDEQFKPMRLNYVCKLPSELIELFPKELWTDNYFDQTTEIQIRTIFSEGWHEVEHDLRYKCKDDWVDNIDLSRNLNGIFATLETCDWSIINIFEQMAYRKYKKNDWEAMIRHKLRTRILISSMNSALVNILNEDNEVAKAILRIDRELFLLKLADKTLINIPKTIDNIVYCMNLLCIENQKITNDTPVKLLEQVISYKQRDHSKGNMS